MSGKLSCANCAYCVQIKSETEIGRVDMFCRRRPPSVVPAPMQTPHGVQLQMLSVFPNVSEALLCGEYKLDAFAGGRKPA